MDNGDLLHQWKGINLRGEAKGTSKVFTSRTDYRFSRFIVCACHVWDLADPKPAYYCHLSKDLRYGAVVRGYTSSNWEARDSMDEHYDDHAERWYYMPTKWVFFFDLDDPLIKPMDFLYAPP